MMLGEDSDGSSSSRLRTSGRCLYHAAEAASPEKGTPPGDKHPHTFRSSEERTLRNTRTDYTDDRSSHLIMNTFRKGQSSGSSQIIDSQVLALTERKQGKLRFKDQIGAFSSLLRAVTFGKICSTSGDSCNPQHKVKSAMANLARTWYGHPLSIPMGLYFLCMPIYAPYLEIDHFFLFP
jgi:hypothetical protein